MDYFHWDGGGDPDFNFGCCGRETHATTDYPWGARRIHGAFCSYVENPILTDVPYASSFEGQQHSSGHYRHEHCVTAVKKKRVRVSGQNTTSSDDLDARKSGNLAQVLGEIVTA